MATIGDRIATSKHQDLYIHPCLPMSWIGRDDANLLVIFDACYNGYRNRRPYRGPLSALRPVSIINAVSTGYPNWERGAK